MRQLKIAVVGRPNVGKSSLFNRLCGRRVAIVDEMEGVTRDRLYRDLEGFGTPYTLVDTGGIDPNGEIAFHDEVRSQAELAIKEADRIILVVDATMSPTHMDLEIARLLLRSKKEIFIAVNKCDTYSEKHYFYEYYALGIRQIFPVSALHGLGVADLLEAALHDPIIPEEASSDERISMAIVGKANVGKSTFLNQILGEERSIVSPISGTTRDSIDSDCTVNGIDYTLIDTAGIRRKKAEHEAVDKFATIRTERAIERAEICLLMLDATQGMAQAEKRILNLIQEKKKGCIIYLNKWDLVDHVRMEHTIQGLLQEAPFLKYCPIVIGSALTGRNTLDVFAHAEIVHAHYHMRISTGKLNRFMEKVIQKTHPPMIDGKRLRIYYLTQLSAAPPRFLLFVNYTNLLTETYKKYIINQFRASYQFTGCPVEFELRQRPKRKRNHEDWADKEQSALASLSEAITNNN